MGGPGDSVEGARARRIRAPGLALLVAAVAGLALVQYVRALAYPFSRDDSVHFAMTERWKRPPARILDHFREDFWAGEPDHGLYRPLTCATIQATAWASGLSPRPLRAGNLLLLVATGLAAAALARRGGLSRGGAAALALLIVAHPLLSEGVLEVVSRGELQATALALVAATLLHGNRRFPLLGALVAAAAFLLALLSKEGAFAALPALLLLLLPMRRHGFFAPALLLLAAVGVALWMRVHVLGGAVGLDPRVVTTLDNCLVDQALGVRVLTGIANLGRFVGLLFWPARLSADYSFAAIVPLHAPDGRFALGAAALAAGGAWLVVALRRGRRLEAFGLLLAGASWFLVSSIATPIGTIFSERVLCMPACGVLLALAAAADRIVGARSPAVRRAVAAVALALVAALGVRTFVRAGDWRNEATLYTAALAVAPESARVQCTVGQWLHEAKDPIGAGARVRRALEIKPDYRRPMSELGRIAFETFRAQRQPLFLAQADVWFWLAANAPGSDADDARNLEQLDDAVRNFGVPRADLERVALAIADAHAGQPLYEKLRIAFATQH
jgi:hypothetical protein